MEITPESRPEIIEGNNECFFKLEGICHHIYSKFEDCPKRRCELCRPLNPIQGK